MAVNRAASIFMVAVSSTLNMETACLCECQCHSAKCSKNVADDNTASLSCPAASLHPASDERLACSL